MVDNAAADGPELLRPIPRRPFAHALREPTPPPDDMAASPEPPPPTTRQPALNLDTINARLLDGRGDGSSAPGSCSISRAESVLNLTGSTLMGIYSPTALGGRGGDRFLPTGDEPSTPWGTGAETPSRGLDIDDANFELRKDRAYQRRRRSSALRPPARGPPLSTASFICHFALRGISLCVLGVLYGIIVAQVRQQRSAAFKLESLELEGLEWHYMAFWGVSGVALGSLLPWFDRIWESTSDAEAISEVSAKPSVAGDLVGKDENTNTDWALAVRGLGAFVGIAFAIRRLPWDSTLQVSLTLALVNPALWFLIDRSMTGFLLSSAVGAVGTAAMMALNPGLVPIPALAASPFGLYDRHNGSSSSSSSSTAAADASYGGAGADTTTPILGGLMSQDRIATGIWVLNVLFCCCVCFGNIGRFLALNKYTTTRGGRRVVQQSQQKQQRR